VKRRDFIASLGSVALAQSLPAQAQQQPGRIRYVAVLMNLAERDPESNPRVRAIEGGLAQLGWTQDRNLRIAYRWAAGDGDLIRKYAAELVAERPDAIIANGTPAAKALQTETQIIPIVFVHVGDPVGLGLVKSLAHPGGNVSGFAFYYDPAMYAKWLQILKELHPDCNEAAAMFNPGAGIYDRQLPVLKAAASSLGLGALIELPVSSLSEIEQRCLEIAANKNIGLVVLPDPFSGAHRDAIVTAVGRHKLYAIYPFRYFTAAGGMLSYGPEQLTHFEAPHCTLGRC
jgi:putative tryptophan/tyrosine transport system substrate-binding protein